MPRPLRLLLLAALCLVALPAASAGARPVTIDHAAHAGTSFDRFLHRYEAANTAFVNGDPSPWLPITAEQDPVSIFGGFGGLGDAGVAAVHQRYLLAATAFRPSGAVVDFEYLVKDVRGRLAYTVAIERSDVLYAGQTERAAADPAGHDDLPPREGRLEDRPPPRRHDGRPAAPVMSWTVACFCGTVFESPADRCPTCHTRVPEVVSAAMNGQPVLRSRMPASRWNVARSTSNAGTRTGRGAPPTAVRTRLRDGGRRTSGRRPLSVDLDLFPDLDAVLVGREVHRERPQHRGYYLASRSTLDDGVPHRLGVRPARTRRSGAGAPIDARARGCSRRARGR